MAELQIGQIGAVDPAIRRDAGTAMRSTLASVAGNFPIDSFRDRTRPINAIRPSPSMRFRLRPSANRQASSVNRPEVTTNPPVAPRAAI
ncbi:MAG TPA: hypothetical protein VLA37_07600, partial [Sphingomonadaceae bacterium]|nr:hypothetical protein [Sphingomonadaceae bacterium]